MKDYRQDDFLIISYSSRKSDRKVEDTETIPAILRSSPSG
jgi:hypothetical protein